MPYKKIAYIIVVVILFAMINNLAHAIYSTWQKQDLIKKAQQDLTDVKNENLQLKSDLARVQKPQFIESEARDKLYLTKPGETIIVLPTGSVIAPVAITPTPTPREENWELWQKRFLK